jgi:RNA polymerase subunit RPABC4/transcription elongation factor Spt4
MRYLLRRPAVRVPVLWQVGVPVRHQDLDGPEEEPDAEVVERPRMCPKCGKPLPSDGQVCPECGKNDDSTEYECPSCGGPVSDKDEVCPKCGARFG